jgi:hypothetical protein
MAYWIAGFIAGIAAGAGIISFAILWREDHRRRVRNLAYRAHILGLVAQQQGRCDICGASTEQLRKERCRGICGRQGGVAA